MTVLWLTYAWKDNEADDVDFIAQKLRSRGIEVRLDRTQLVAGRRLWDQIDQAIRAPDLNGWAVYVTENSLKSEAVQEELAYALDRTLRTRGGDFPLIGIFPTPLAREIIPSAIATRLWVHLKDNQWDHRVAAAFGPTTVASPGSVQSIEITPHQRPDRYILELRPRDGNWFPANFAVKLVEFDALFRSAYKGPRGQPDYKPAMFHHQFIELDSPLGKFKGWGVMDQVDSTCSLYAVLKAKPSAFACGGKLLQVFFPD